MTRDRHLPAWALERLAFEPVDLDPSTLAHRDACGACRGRIEQLLRERDAFLARRPVRPFVGAVAAQAERDASMRRRWRAARAWLLATGAIACAAVLIVSIRTGTSRQRAGEVRFKGNGGTALTVYVSRDGGAARPLRPDDLLRAGDVVRFGVVAPGGGHVAIASVDDEGRVSRYFPQQGSETAPIADGEGQRVLPGSIVLDETAGREWIVLVVSRAPLDPAEVEKAVRRAWRERRGDDLGPIPIDASVRTVRVRKVTR